MTFDVDAAIILGLNVFSVWVVVACSLGFLDGERVNFTAHRNG